MASDGEKLGEISRAIGNLEGKMDSVLKSTNTMQRRWEEEMNQVWAKSAALGERLGVCETEIGACKEQLGVIVREALHNGIRGGGIVLGAGAGLAGLVWFVKYVLIPLVQMG